MSMTVGGQAVIEGVMMRTPHSMAIAVRRADGSIEVRDEAWYSVGKRWRFLKWPFARGGVTLWESLHNGMSALSWSAERATLDDERMAAAAAIEDARTPDGSAPVEVANPGPAEVDDRQDEESTAPMAGSLAISGTIALSLLFAFALFIALPHGIALLGGRVFDVESLDGTSMPFHVVAGLFKVLIFLAYLWAISRLEDIRRVFQYHGAEHKSIFAWEAQEPLDIAHASAHGRLHPRCGTSFLFIVILTSIVVFAVVFGTVEVPVANKILKQLTLIAMKLPLLFPIAGIAYEIQRLSARHPNAAWLRPLIWPGLMLQRITTQEPDAGQIEVAIASLRSALAREQDVLAGQPDPGRRETRYEAAEEIAWSPSLAAAE